MRADGTVAPTGPAPGAGAGAGAGKPGGKAGGPVDKADREVSAAIARENKRLQEELQRRRKKPAFIDMMVGRVPALSSALAPSLPCARPFGRVAVSV